MYIPWCFFQKNFWEVFLWLSVLFNFKWQIYWILCFLLLSNKISQTECLKSTQIYYLRDNVGHKSGHGVAGFSAQSLMGWNQDVGWSFSSHLGSGFSSKFTGCWQTLFPCNSRIQVPIHLLAIGWSQLSAPRCCLQFFTM